LWYGGFHLRESDVLPENGRWKMAIITGRDREIYRHRMLFRLLQTCVNRARYMDRWMDRRMNE